MRSSSHQNFRYEDSYSREVTKEWQSSVYFMLDVVFETMMFEPATALQFLSSDCHVYIYSPEIVY